MFVSHDLEEALKIGSTIAIMEGGRIVQTGPPEVIVTRPATDYLRDFVANVNRLSVLTLSAVLRPVTGLEPDGAPGERLWIDRRTPAARGARARGRPPPRRGGRPAAPPDP